LAEELGKGEASSIALALELEECLLIIDERKGRKIAEDLGIDTIGSLGILIKERVVNNLPVWAVSFSTMRRCFVGHLALAKLPSRALPGEKIASPNSGNLFAPHS